MNPFTLLLPAHGLIRPRALRQLLRKSAPAAQRVRPLAATVLLWLATLGTTTPVFAQSYGRLPQGPMDAAALQRAMPELASRLLHDLPDDSSLAGLDRRFRLELAADRYEQALGTMATLRERLRGQAVIPTRADWVTVPYEIYAHARINEAADHLDGAKAYGKAFRDRFATLDDWPSAEVARSFTETQPAELQASLQADLAATQGKAGISQIDAVRLVSDYLTATVFGQASLLAPALIKEDDGRRYLTQQNVLVKEAGGASVCAYVMRPRKAGPLPALLEFTIYASSPEVILSRARLSAARNYAGVLGFTRGKVCSPNKPSAYLTDADDTSALIDWISHQPWSDGRVGMYGGSYEGFTQWAAAKRMPKALKAIMPSTPVAPGIDVPMEGNVFWNFVYPWPFYTLNAKFNDKATYGNAGHWRQLDRAWYASGRAYRDLDKIDGTPNPTFDEWLSHPSYDAYWQGMIPYGTEFSRVTLPVLLVAGYYYGGPGAAIYYFQQLEKYAPASEHYLLIGPYHHIGAQYGVLDDQGNLMDTLAGLSVDPVAQLDMYELRYQWFDYVFKRGPKPALLGDMVNYEVTGANVWKHAPSLSAMGNTRLRLHLDGGLAPGPVHRLDEKPSDGKGAAISLTVDLADRSDTDADPLGGGVVDSAIDTRHALQFVSQPFDTSIELSGLFSGQLDFVTNKKDFDVEIDLFELTAQGQYVQLSQYWTRASYADDRTQRRLLLPGREQHLVFESSRLMSRQLKAGSRLVMVLGVIKGAGRQINYGSGKDVSDETVRDAGDALSLRWLPSSYIELPVRDQPTIR
ncbi:CocE/NonD family hydrolase [Dyella sp. C9]|uniref:CocE/NonD family hydrolase n=1 Tax=Dyella sp. C9 TaxID=2202154 RepID=UPI000DEF19C9|nr:CocE/NonD family hydrolase [Dyella sp. C9]